MLVAGRLWRTPRVPARRWFVEAVRHHELGRRLRTAAAAGHLHTCDALRRLDRKNDHWYDPFYIDCLKKTSHPVALLASEMAVDILLKR